MSHDATWIAAGLLASVLIFGVIQLMAGRRRLSRQRVERQQFPEMLDLLIQSLKGGADLPTALGVVAEMGPRPGSAAFAQCRDQVLEGVALAEALSRLTPNSSSFTIPYLATLLQAIPYDVERTRQALIRLESINRHAAGVAAEVEQHVASVHKTSIAVFVFVPVAAVLLLMFSPWYRSNLDHHTAGQLLICIATALYSVGGLWLLGLWSRRRRIRRTWSWEHESLTL